MVAVMMMMMMTVMMTVARDLMTRFRQCQWWS